MQPELGELGLSEVEKISSVVRTCVAGPTSVRKEGEYFVAVEPNSFGIPSVDTCPGRTPYCESDCYAIESEYRNATAIKLQRNLDILRAAESDDELDQKLETMMAKYRQRADRLGIPQTERRFRWHWSGDFYNLTYAHAFARVIKKNPDIQFYTYTRSFRPNMNVVPALAGIDNLDLFLSVDFQNVDDAKPVLDAHPHVKAAYLVDYYEDAATLQKQLGRTEGFRHRPCPENMRDETGKRKLPVISAKGGACSRCTYCIGKPNTWDVVFVKTGQVEQAQQRFDIDPVPVEITRSKKRKVVSGAVGATSVAATQSLFAIEEI